MEYDNVHIDLLISFDILNASPHKTNFTRISKLLLDETLDLQNAQYYAQFSRQIIPMHIGDTDDFESHNCWSKIFILFFFHVETKLTKTME